VSPEGEAGEAGAPSLASGPSPQEWIAACRRVVAAHRDVFAAHEGIVKRTVYQGVGKGGDRTLVIDRLCEDAVFSELERLHAAGHDFLAISEERGEVAFGGGGEGLRVVVDPIDGSLNARRTIPSHSLSFAVAGGSSMADVEFGYVFEFGAGEEFIAVRGQGATLDGEALRVPAGDGLELVAVEATKPERVVPVAGSLSGRAYRIRTPGSIAISLCYVAAARFDGMLSTRQCRSVDAAAGQLVAQEAGAVVAFGEARLDATPLDLAGRYDVAAARTTGDLQLLREAQEAVE
jgi:myo-inositol-1(or 4)-monophosphatase